MNLVVAITVPLRYDENIKVFRGALMKRKTVYINLHPDYDYATAILQG